MIKEKIVDNKRVLIKFVDIWGTVIRIKWGYLDASAHFARGIYYYILGESKRSLTDQMGGGLYLGTIYVLIKKNTTIKLTFLRIESAECDTMLNRNFLLNQI